MSRDRVDELINLVGELVITKTMMKQVVGTLGALTAERLEAILAQLERNTRDLQDRVMSIRMLPMSHAFGRFARLVRDVGQRTGKQVHLEITGGDAELDKSVIEKLVDPLTHLVRNALDHGIETPGERVAAGKPEAATLKLHAEHKGGHIEIRIADDGRGVDLQRVRGQGARGGAARGGRVGGHAARLRADLRAGLLHRRGGERALRPRRGPGRGAQEHPRALREPALRFRAGQGRRGAASACRSPWRSSTGCW